MYTYDVNIQQIQFTRCNQNQQKLGGLSSLLLTVTDQAPPLDRGACTDIGIVRLVDFDLVVVTYVYKGG